MEVLIVALAVFIILFWLASAFLAMGIALVYLFIVTGILPWWAIIPMIAGWIWWLGGERSDQ